VERRGRRFTVLDPRNHRRDPRLVEPAEPGDRRPECLHLLLGREVQDRRRRARHRLLRQRDQLGCDDPLREVRSDLLPGRRLPEL